jgi:GT2 family glycosyltransferase/glycosyltransferase involved in cell wall biosynthesis
VNLLDKLNSKRLSAVIVMRKVENLLCRAFKVMRVSPTLLPQKVWRKLLHIIKKRIDLGVFYKGHVRIGGQFYPAEDLFQVEQIEQVEKAHADTGVRSSIAVIVPIYRGLEITKRCIDSILTSDLPEGSRLVLINDCSPDVGMKDLLETYVPFHKNLVTVLHNEKNLGFVKTVNKGMRLYKDFDVVLVNSDTVVAADWLTRLAICASSRAKVATVTATSNNATICSFPVMEGVAAWPLGLDTNAIQNVFSKHNRGRSVEIPTGVGFCFYVTRLVLDELGYFDEDAFGKGYGEENDFCMRALKRGWLNLQAMDAGVFHEGEVSFGQDSSPGKAHASAIILSRYPNYNLLVGEYASRDPARGYRLGALLALLKARGRPVELVVTHVHGGGVARAVGEVVAKRKNVIDHLCLQRCGERGFYKISSLVDDVRFDIEFSSRYAPDILHQVLSSVNARAIQVHQIMDVDLPLLHELKKVQLPIDVFVHDYWTICPQVTLTKIDGSYCGEPDEKTCNSCIARRGERTHAPLADGLAREIHGWREQYRWLFDRARQIIVPSKDVATRMNRYYPKANITVIYHEDQRALLATSLKPRSLSNGEVLRVAVLGSIGVHKGLHRIADVISVATSRKLAVDIKVIGELDPLIKTEPFIPHTGAYRDEDLEAILEKNQIHVIWFPEGAPETYSYTLSHAMRLGYPVVVPDIGAFSERVVGRDWTWVMKQGASTLDVLETLEIIQGRLSKAT